LPSTVSAGSSDARGWDQDDNEGVFVTEAQTWTMIGVFTATFIGMLTVVSTLFVHVLRTEVRRLDDKLGGIDKRFDGIDRRLDGIDNRLDRMDQRIDSLDNVVQVLVRRSFGIGPTE
jgi:hypothetical protein